MPLAFLAFIVIFVNVLAAILSAKPAAALFISIEATSSLAPLGISSFNSETKPDVDVS